MHPTGSPLRRFAAVFVALLVLLALTVEAARHDLGHWNFPVAATIATAKALLIALVFMELHESRALTRLVAAAGLIWLAILFMLSLSDYFTRAWDA